MSKHGKNGIFQNGLRVHTSNIIFMISIPDINILLVPKLMFSGSTNPIKYFSATLVHDLFTKSKLWVPKMLIPNRHRETKIWFCDQVWNIRFINFILWNCIYKKNIRLGIILRKCPNNEQMFFFVISQFLDQLYKYTCGNRTYI